MEIKGRSILTVTLNPCVDKTLTFDSPFRIARTNRVSDYLYSPGGKGINVSRTLRRMGNPAPAVFPVGGETGRHLMRMLEKDGISTYPVESAAETRTCLKMVDPEGICTEANEAGGPLTESELSAIEDILYGKAGNVWPSSTAYVFSGSVPRGVPKTVYRDWITALKEQGAYTVLDTSGEALIEGVKACPDLIKPNADELAMLCGKAPEGNTFNEYTMSAIELADEVVKEYGCAVLCTLGAWGAAYVSYDYIFRVNAEMIRAKSTTGAGDVFLGAFLHEMRLQYDPPGALLFAAYASGDKLMYPGTEIPETIGTRNTGALKTEQINGDRL